MAQDFCVANGSDTLQIGPQPQKSASLSESGSTNRKVQTRLDDTAGCSNLSIDTNNLLVNLEGI
jgi:hypothetical protein